jgi:putative transposase
VRIDWKVSIRRACSTLRIDRALYVYKSKRGDQAALKGRIKDICETRVRYGYRRVHVLLQRDGWAINVKRTYRVYRQEGLMVLKRLRKKQPVPERQPLVRPLRPNEVWSMDFVSDSLANGRRLKCLTVADDFSHEAVDIAVDYGISGQYVIRLLDQAARFRGYPAAIRTDNGPEFTSRAFIGWAQSHGIRHILIEPGRPMQNGYIERFNRTYREEVLNYYVFETLGEVRRMTSEWMPRYNETRPHESLGNLSPRQYLMAKSL